MRKQILILMVLSMAFVLFQQSLYAFENKKTHPILTERAAKATIDDYLKTQVGLSNGINTQLLYDFPEEMQIRINRANWDSGKTQRTLLEWLKVGSAIEDTDTYLNPYRDDSNKRPRHHFYDPTRNAGMNNKDDNPDWNGWPDAAMGLRGGSALTWAINGTAPSEPTVNNQSWQKTRDDFYSALTQSTKSNREKYLAISFLDLGCVLHMLEDMGVPAHTRNDFLFAHYRTSKDYGDPFETRVERDIGRNGNSLSRWVSGGWTPTPQVFSRVSDYFDAGVYNGNYLGDGVPTPSTWGLSERTNYQFLSWSTIFEDNFLTSLYWFPNPAKINTADVNDFGYVYLSGYGVDHLAAQTLSKYHLKHEHLNKAWCIIGEAVTDDYAEITIPRTINYTTGLTNYFFRGRLSATLDYNTCEEIELNITNESENSGTTQYLKGGAFELYWEDPDGDRTEITGLTVFDSDNPADDDEWSSSCSLAHGNSIRAKFTKPSGAIEKFILIYKGNICENTSELDSDDSDALAMAIIENPGCPFASNDCGCFLDPSTPTWDSNTTYSTGDLVEDCYYGCYTYKSNAGNNINHRPRYNPAWWTKVSNTISNGNDNWDGYPPFGGIGKSPKHLSVTFSGIERGDYCEPFGQCSCNPLQLPTPNRRFIVTQGGESVCSSDGGCFYSCDSGPIPQSETDPPIWHVEVYFDSSYMTVSLTVFSYADYGSGYNICDCDVFICGRTDINGYPPNGCLLIEWENNFDYIVGDLIGNNDVQYYCKSSHKSSTSNRPGEGANWQSYWDTIDGCNMIFEKTFAGYRNIGNYSEEGSGHVTIEPTSAPSYPLWTLNYDYEEGDIIIGSDNEKYVCNVAHTSTLTDKPITGANWETYWSLAGGCCGE